MVHHVTRSMRFRTGTKDCIAVGTSYLEIMKLETIQTLVHRGNNQWFQLIIL